MKAKKKSAGKRVASNDVLERLFTVTEYGTLRCVSVDLLLQTPQARRQLAACARLRSNAKLTGGEAVLVE